MDRSLEPGKNWPEPPGYLSEDGSRDGGSEKYQNRCLDGRTDNSLWAGVLVETLVRLGLQTAVLSPGSRSTPLTLAFAQHPGVKAVPILDERSASFFALGRSRASGRATVLVCTSGTAGANYFPAVIEARESGVPLLLLTADRPPELRACASGQTIDQQKLFGTYPRFYGELPLPQRDEHHLCYLRQALVAAWHQAHFPTPGPVHLNCPFRDPLAPTGLPPTPITLPPQFWMGLSSPVPQDSPSITPGLQSRDSAPPALRSGRSRDCPGRLVVEARRGAGPDREGISTGVQQPQPQGRGVIIAGPAQPWDRAGYCAAIAAIAHALNWPILAEGLSPLRNHGQSGVITHYEAILRQETHCQALVPDQVLQIGPLPTSKTLRQWLAQADPLRWILSDRLTTPSENLDPLHGRSRPWIGSLAALVASLPQGDPAYGQQWSTLEAMVTERLRVAMTEVAELFEAKIAWLLPQVLPRGTAVWVANSMPVRDVEWFWPWGDRGLRPFFNRGANGIDGTLSSALGMAQGEEPAVLLTGDLSLLHDSNGFLIAPYLQGSLTIILVNNQGGGIFEMLPVAQTERQDFERFFATPQRVVWASLCAAHGVAYRAISTWEELIHCLKVLPEQGIQVLEVCCDRQRDAQRRRHWLSHLAAPHWSPDCNSPSGHA